MKTLKFEQRTPEWYAARLGIPTASSFSKIITSSGKKSTQWSGYLHELVAERITGRMVEFPSTPAMEEGTRREDESRLVYQMEKESPVTQVGFCVEDGGRWGCSPDGLVGDDGLVEFKNPSDKVAVEYLLDGKLPTKYFIQVQGQIFVAERDWCDFVSYDPGLPMLIVPVKRDDEFISKLEPALIKFNAELEAAVKKIMGMGPVYIGERGSVEED